MEDWHVLSIYDGDPTPGTPASITAMATAVQRRAAEINGHAARLRSVAANSGAMSLRGDYATTVDRELGRLPGTAKTLADAYLAAAKALSAFANDLTQLQVHSRGALRIGMTADSQYRAMLQQFCGLTGMRTYGAGVWRGLNESYAAQLREPVRSQALGVARNARLCEAERERARASALQAKDRYTQAAARCAAALRDALRGLPKSAAVTRNDPEAVEDLFGMSSNGAKPLGGTSDGPDGLNRVRGKGSGPKMPIKMDSVRRIAAKYGIDLAGVTINIKDSKAGRHGVTRPDGSVDLWRDAFRSEEDLARTLAHERFHVEELRRGLPYPKNSDEAVPFEDRAYAYEDEWWDSHSIRPEGTR
ncbi:hypothetical protein [Micromonospora sp. NPDC005203]|uniref:hypothetical protein n=1 Tax=Micromonospora sp. NPDC005203 TaxID=3364226 RepID=UPI003680FBFA